jgi:hypothetical protein
MQQVWTEAFSNHSQIVDFDGQSRRLLARLNWLMGSLLTLATGVWLDVSSRKTSVVLRVLASWLMRVDERTVIIHRRVGK